MKALDKESSMYKPRQIRLPKFRNWLDSLREYSDKYRTHGMFLPTQDELLRDVYNGIARTKSKVMLFSSPPSSGKTHVIALCSAYFHSHGVATCIVTPNNELRVEFANEVSRLNCPSASSLPVLNLGSYLLRKDQFECVFIDEAHNIRSAVELDPFVVKTIHLETGDRLFDMVASSMGRGSGYIARELDIQNTHDILLGFRNSVHERIAASILRNLTEWRTFCFLSDTSCDLKFLAADPEKRSIMPRGRLLLFSATPVNAEELQFYCGIPQRIPRERYDVEGKFGPRKNVKYVKVRCKTDSEKRKLAISVLQRAIVPSLILLKSNNNCVEWEHSLSRKLSTRIICIPSGTRYAQRQELYKRFVSSLNGIFITSSNVYWEGITIHNLRLLIIPDPPYPRPSLLELACGKHTEYHRIAKRRLIQGMGRIGRVGMKDGICLLLFDPAGLDGHISPVTKENVMFLVSKSNSAIV